jgi:shikimate kinase
VISPRRGRDEDAPKGGETTGAGDLPDRSVGHVVLVGMMGAGKTAVGRRLAQSLGRPFVDVDVHIEGTTGHTIAELFERDGEAAFRDEEAAALTEVLNGPRGSVVATGGGAVLREDNRRLMRERGTVVWLRARPETLAARVGSGDERPLLTGDPLGTLTRLADERAAAYADAAQLIVDVDALDEEQVVLLIDATLAASL